MDSRYWPPLTGPSRRRPKSLTSPEPEPKPLVVKVPDARRMLGNIGKTKLYELINERELERIRIGARTMLTVKSIESYVARQAAQAV